MSFLKSLLGSSNDRELKKLNKTADDIEALEPEMKKLSDDDFPKKTEELKTRCAGGESLEALLPEAFALVREAALRVYKKHLFRVQLLGGIVLHQGRIAEMKTGEGKTLTAPLAAYLNALTGKGVHIVTVNDYLARFQGEEIDKLFRFLGMRVGIIVHDLTNEQRRDAYLCDVTYGTNNEMCFDYLRDNMVIYEKDMVQRGHNFAVVDEVDSILIDEARTPLIISGQGDKSTEMYSRADQFASRLREGEENDYTLMEKEKSVTLTEDGVKKAEKHFGVESLTDPDNSELYHHILAALKAHALMKRDVNYVVKNGEVIIVDEFTGRLMVGRRYSDGLHQAIEAKEHVKVERESKTLATITFQNYFRMYKKLSGMTGTAKTEEQEFQSIYSLDVVQIPTNKPMIRKDMNDMVYRTEAGKFRAVVQEIKRRHATGQPILVGTVSVEKSELLSTMLDREGIDHTVLNAKHHEREAEIVAQAGHFGAVTIATNMAGRGTDILLGGNPEFLARQALKQKGISDGVIEMAIGYLDDVPEEVLSARKEYYEKYAELKKTTDAEHERVVGVGGLHILGTERHESRRIDNQLRGRSGRQGDPGSSQFFISLEDDVMRLFGSERISSIVAHLGMGEDEPLEAKMLTSQIENAQKRIEGRNFDIRKNVLEYDDVMNQQREVIYGQRHQVLHGEDMHAAVMKMLNDYIDASVDAHCAADDGSEWNFALMATELEGVCLPVGYLKDNETALRSGTSGEAAEKLKKDAGELYESREKAIAEIGLDMREVERVMLLRSVDSHWMDHIDAMDQLRDGIGLRAYGQRNPVQEYKLESYDMFDEMVREIRHDTLQRVMMSSIQRAPQRVSVVKSVKPLEMNAQGAQKPSVPKVGRNSPCPCGSGKKYKHCCGKND
ncbi:MAG: preprotein translocase subunit SecA [Eubacteriales bacterium]|nr:preprotein translocase subunit SecA [Eubacteriales bacterium]MDD3882420.1 preprotein translocase subunit SecA [Eubacteriales bacterium]MDD4513801.1 preprotein translocase subunit SecA [Eubacteriales bacterium]